MMMVVKKPSIDVAFAERGLDGGEVHEQTSIVNNAAELSESPARKKLEKLPSYEERIPFFVDCGSVSQAVRKTRRGAFPRIFIK
jgi:hypothetical protein